jgi:hypothetical protein
MVVYPGPALSEEGSAGVGDDGEDGDEGDWQPTQRRAVRTSRRAGRGRGMDGAARGVGKQGRTDILKGGMRFGKARKWEGLNGGGWRFQGKRGQLGK